jgi:hypothetical protein
MSINEKLFRFTKLNGEGLHKAQTIADIFATCLNALERECPESREFSIVKTKLQEACFFAMTAMTSLSENQDR